MLHTCSISPFFFTMVNCIPFPVKVSLCSLTFFNWFLHLSYFVCSPDILQIFWPKYQRTKNVFLPIWCRVNKHTFLQYTKEKLKYNYLDTQSSSNIPPRARAESPGGKTQVTGGKSLLDSPASRANPVGIMLM